MRSHTLTLVGQRQTRLRSNRKVNAVAFWVMVALAPILALATFAVLGEMEWLGGGRSLRFILLADFVYALIVAGFVARRVAEMIAARRRGSAGSNLHLRLVRFFTLIALIPTIIVAVFAAITLNFGLEGWFSDRVRNVVSNSLAAAQAYDLIVAGSDQIWSPSQHFGFDPNYFLAFAQSFPARKISYAASFGRDLVSAEEAAQLPGLLHHFDAISVREASGVALVERSTGQRPANVPDPTLLLNSYAELTDPTPSDPDAEPYLFCYGLRSPDNIRQTAEFVASQLGCPILSPHNPHRRWIEIGQTVYPDPAEWVALVKNARFVVTNSFHGTVFALLFKKPFIVAGLTGDKASANARAIHLLRTVGLESRFAPSFSAQRTDALMATPIDWAAVDLRLADLRQAGNEFLSGQLQAVAP